MKIGSILWEWTEIWGTVPQGILLEVLLFVIMINDLQTECCSIKYVDDTTIFHATDDPTDTNLQDSVTAAVNWSQNNNMKINSSKTKEMLISFSKSTPDVPNIEVQGTNLERVSKCTLLGVELNNKLDWSDHIAKVYKRASQRLHFLSALRKTKIPQKDMLQIYTSLIRPITEYATQVWHPALTGSETQLLESVQERALAMIFPDVTYEKALELSSLSTLSSRREELCKRLFIACQDEDHKLHPLLPPKREIIHQCRNSYKFQLPVVKTNRYKDSFINFSLFNRW